MLYANGLSLQKVFMEKSENTSSQEYFMISKLNVDRAYGISQSAMNILLQRAEAKYLKAKVHAGEALGAVVSIHLKSI